MSTVRAHFEDLGTLLAVDQIDKEKALPAALGTLTLLAARGGLLEAAGTGNAEGLFLLAASNRRANERSVQLWLGEKDFSLS